VHLSTWRVDGIEANIPNQHRRYILGSIVVSASSAYFEAVPVVLGTIALLACLHPARRAASLDPVVTLRDA
jgi:ABC-type lipoprotein release transport system permease subunit